MYSTYAQVTPLCCCAVRCLAKFGVYPSQTLGVDGKLRFHSDNPLTLLDGHAVHAKWYFFALEDVHIGNPMVRRHSVTQLSNDNKTSDCNNCSLHADV